MFKNVLRILFTLVVYAVCNFSPIYINEIEISVFAAEDTLTTNDQVEPVISNPPAPPPQSNLDLTVSPITVLFETPPGSAVSETIRIHNNSSAAEYLSLSLATFSPDPSGERPLLREFDAADPSATWLSFSESTFILNPGEWKSVSVTFRPPRSAAFDYYYAIVVDRQSTVSPAPGETVLTGAPAILALAHVTAPNSLRELQLVSFTTPKFVFEFLPVEFAVVVENTGNAFTAPNGSIFIDSAGATDIAILPFNPEKGHVLPNSERSFTTSWTDGFPLFVRETVGSKDVKDAEGKQRYRVEWDFSQADRFRIGKYTANLLLIYDAGNRDIPIEATVSFWVIPWRVVGGAAVLVLFFISLGAVIATLINRRKKSVQS